jgi:uncharacterized phage protein (TIGR01671 family)
MREIKFRVWDKLEKSMHMVITLHNPFHMDFCDYALGQSSDSVRSVQYKDCEIMEFTGLKDKNGKEIYEGDIIITHDTSNGRTVGFEGRIFKVIFDKGSFELIREGNQESLGILCSYEGMIEVLGNIYEDKALLELSEEKNDKNI